MNPSSQPPSSIPDGDNYGNIRLKYQMNAQYEHQKLMMQSYVGRSAEPVPRNQPLSSPRLSQDQTTTGLYHYLLHYHLHHVHTDILLLTHLHTGVPSSTPNQFSPIIGGPPQPTSSRIPVSSGNLSSPPIGQPPHPSTNNDLRSVLAQPSKIRQDQQYRSFKVTTVTSINHHHYEGVYFIISIMTYLFLIMIYI